MSNRYSIGHIATDCKSIIFSSYQDIIWNNAFDEALKYFQIVIHIKLKIYKQLCTLNHSKKGNHSTRTYRWKGYYFKIELNHMSFSKIGREVVFQCRDEGPLRARVRWVRPAGRPLPPGSRDNNGRLEIPNIRVFNLKDFLNYWNN